MQSFVHQAPGSSRRPAAVLAAALMAAVSACASPQEGQEVDTAAVTSGEFTRVTGIGGVFFKSSDPARTLEWYRTHLGIDAEDYGAFAFQWTEKDRPDQTGYTVWSVFPDSSEYLAPSEEPYMVNFRVADLDALITALTREGVRVVGGIEEHPNGKFAWILDPEGRKIELWEPVPSQDDPYLR